MDVTDKGSELYDFHATLLKVTRRRDRWKAVAESQAKRIAHQDRRIGLQDSEIQNLLARVREQAARIASDYKAIEQRDADHRAEVESLQHSLHEWMDKAEEKMRAYIERRREVLAWYQKRAESARETTLLVTVSRLERELLQVRRDGARLESLYRVARLFALAALVFAGTLVAALWWAA